MRSGYDKNKKPRAKKSLGQNFLIDQNYVEKIITSLKPQNDETIVEIGAGRGALTKYIVGKVDKVFAIELDRNLIPILQEEFSSYKNIILIEKDALEINFQNLLALQSVPHKTKLVANLPYYISTAILQHLIQYRSSFSELVVMLQREVVSRITAQAGNKERGFLTVLIEAYFETEKLFDVSPNAFFPKPKIWSSVIRLKPRKFENVNEEFFREIVSLGFRQKRKTILNNLKNAEGDLLSVFEEKGGIGKVLEKAGIAQKRRAETISLEEWKSLVETL